MRILINLFAMLGVAIAVFMVAQLYIGFAGDAFDEGRGMASVFLQLWAVIGILAALLFGFIGRVMDRRVPRPAHLISNGSIAVGLVCGLLLFAAPLVFG